MPVMRSCTMNNADDKQAGNKNTCKEQIISANTLAANEVQVFGELSCRYLIRSIGAFTTKTF